MRVAYPKGGPHVLALFNTSWQKGHGILARTWAQAEKVFRTDKFQRHIADEGDLRVKRALDINIVSAPISWRQKLAAKVYEEERETFRHSLLFSVRGLPTLPTGFARCPHYAPSIYASQPMPDDLKEGHFLCDTCNGSDVVVKRARVLEIYARAASGDDPMGLLEGSTSTWGHAPNAPPADPGQELMVLSEISGVKVLAFDARLNPHDIRHTICHFQIRSERTDVADRLQSAVDALYADLARPSEEDERCRAEAERAEAQAREAKNEALRRFLG